MHNSLQIRALLKRIRNEPMRRESIGVDYANH